MGTNNKRQAILAIALAFTFNACDSGGGGGGVGGDGTGGKSSNSGNPGTPDSYTLVSYNSNSFTYNWDSESYRCIDLNGGTLEKETYDFTEAMGYSMYYSNGNYILVLGRCNSWSSGMNGIMNCTGFSDTDTIHFKGTSSNLIGTWTRTKDKAASCKMKTERYCKDYDSDKCECKEYKEESWMDCKEYWDYTKLVFTQNTVAITRDYCRTDGMIDEEVRDNGWRYKITGCDTYEMSKGTEKVTVRINKGTNWESWEGTYKGKTCKLTETSVSQRAKACSDAWKTGVSGSELEEAYYDLLDKERFKCLVDNNFPEESYKGGGDADDPLPSTPCYNNGY
jgi:hypothetical protein